MVDAAASLRQRDFTPKPELKKCRACDVRTVCGAAAHLIYSADDAACGQLRPEAQMGVVATTDDVGAAGRLAGARNVVAQRLADVVAREHDERRPGGARP